MSDELDRLKAMLDPKQQTWDLSPNDIKAIRWVVERLAAAEAALIRYGSHMDNCRSRYPYTNVTRIHECDCGWEELNRAAKGGRDERTGVNRLGCTGSFGAASRRCRG